MEEMEDDEVTTDEEKLLKDENIPGLTICNQEVEMKIMEQLNEHLNGNEENENSDANDSENRGEKLPIMLINDRENETENERKIRLGEMTPFGTTLQSVLDSNSVSEEDRIFQYLKRQEELRKKYAAGNSTTASISTKRKSIPKRSKTRKKISLGTEIDGDCKAKSNRTLLSEKTTVDFTENSGSEYVPTSEEIDDSDMEFDENATQKSNKRRKKCRDDLFADEAVSDSDSPFLSSKLTRIKIRKEMDDGDENRYQSRLKTYETSFDTTDMLFHEFENCNFHIPLEIWSKLYNYQKVGVQWLWELHQQGIGGILADEMGLGKTIQVISFFSGLFYSKLKNKYNSFRGLGSSLIVCPTTLMYQWVKEFHEWLPPVRIAILHACGSFSGKKQNLIRDIYRNRGVLITSYVGMLQLSEELLRYNWHYVVLDEGHKIRNPDAKITLAVKQLKTPHRLILSGSPLQNNLEELWSLFDFIYPGKLGSLPLFQSQFTIPITHGGYANASNVEVTIAYKCATVLKELISPYLLRRSKQDVKSHINLPQKNEQILFCQLTDEQRALYKGYIDSGEVNRILEGQMQIFVGLINLRKICNHPDLYSGGPGLIHEQKSIPEEKRYGHWKKSGKMIVLETLLKIWHKQNHKVLLFTQSRKMLDILEAFLCRCNYTYLKMDGSTYIGSRQPLINTFNTDVKYFVMLLTTKVGGLGVNLTGASRVVIFDPDWNPATDTQARERAWRIGQTQDVTIYRLISVGTIEEKMYHRQIFKQFLTNKVLKDPKQRRFFKSNDLFELFTLKESDTAGSTETGAIFAGTGSEINLNSLTRKTKKRKRLREKRIQEKIACHFSKDKIEKMKLIAQRISQKLSKTVPTPGKTTTSMIEHDCAEKPKAHNIEVNVENRNRSVETSCNNVDSILETSSKTKENASEKESVTSKSGESASTEKRTAKEETNTNEIKNDTELPAEKITPKKKNRKSYFEGEYIPYLVASKKSKAAKQIEKEENEVKVVEDEYVLQKLFSKAGICSALQHDAIMEGGPADFAIVEKEAEKIAQEAIDELKRSQEMCFPAHTGIPNWTGKHGCHAKDQLNSTTLSSSEILDKIKKRNGIVEISQTETKLLKNLKNFILNEGGTACTDRLINNFRNQLPASMTPLFKCLLNKTCSFYRGPDKKGYWTLKSEFLN